MVRRGHSPLRTCVVCRAKGDKWSLLRMALDNDRSIVLDRRQQMRGRGVYVCPGCLPQLRFDARLRRAFRNRAGALSPENPPPPKPSTTTHQDGKGLRGGPAWERQ